MTYDEKVRAVRNWMIQHGEDEDSVAKALGIKCKVFESYLTLSCLNNHEQFWDKLSEYTGIDFDGQITIFQNLPPHIIRCLKAYGNAVIGEKYIKKYGRKAILDCLKEHGYDCKLRVEKSRITAINNRVVGKPTYILEVKG